MNNKKTSKWILKIFLSVIMAGYSCSSNTFDLFNPDKKLTAGRTQIEDASTLIVQPEGVALEVTETEGVVDYTYEIVLPMQPLSDVTVEIIPAGGLVTINGQIVTVTEPLILTFTPENWNVPQTVTISGIPNDTITSDVTETIEHTFKSSDVAYNNLTTNIVLSILESNIAGLIFSKTSVVVDEVDGGTPTSDAYTIQLKSQPDGDVVVNVNSSDTVNGVTVSPSSLTFTADSWNNPQTVTVTAIDDDSAESNQTVIISHSINTTLTTDSNYVLLTGGLGTVSATSIDDDTAGVTVLPTNITIFESAAAGSTSATYTVRLNTHPVDDVVILLSVSDSGNQDATISETSLTFTSSNWSTNQTVTVTAIDDVIADNTQTIEISHSIDTINTLDQVYNAYTIPNTSPEDLNYKVVVSINDDETVGVLVTPINISLSEGGAGVDYNVSLVTEPVGDVVIDVTPTDTTNGVKVNNIASLTLTFTPSNWNTPQTINVTAIDDTTIETTPHSVIINHTINGTTTDTSGYSSLTNINDVTASITDNDTPGVTISKATVSVAEDAGVEAYTIVLNKPPVDNVVLNITSSDTTNGVTVSPGSVTFTPANWNTAQTVAVIAAGDNIDETITHTATITHTINIAGTLDSNYDTLTGISSITANITDNDTANIVLSKASIIVDETGPTNDTYTIVLTSEPTSIVTINNTSTSTTNGVSVSPPAVTFTSANWNAPQTITVTAVDDATNENTHSALIVHSIDTAVTTDNNYTALNGTINNVLVNIIDNESAGVSFSETNVTVDETGPSSATYTVRLNTQPTGDVEIILYSGIITYATVSPSSLVFTNSDWNTPQTVTVTAVDDAFAQGAHSTLITHNINTANTADTDYDALFGDLNNVNVNIIDNDQAGVTISKTSISIDETGPTATSYTIRLNSAPTTGNVVISLASGDNVEGASVSPSSLTFTNANWQNTQTVIVTAIDDAVQEGAHSTSITHTIDTINTTDTLYNALSITDIVSVNIIDNDQAGVTISKATVSVNELGPTSENYTVRLNSLPTDIVVIDLSSSDIANGATISPSTLTFDSSNWNIPHTVVITGIDDNLDESSTHTATISHILNTTSTLDPDYDLLTLSPEFDITTNITDNDTASFSINDVTVTEGDGGSVNAVFTVTQSIESLFVTTVSYSTAGSTATTADNDYIGTAGTLTFNPGGSLTQTISVAVNGDTKSEGVSEQFFVNLSTPTGGATISDNQGIGTITDDDLPEFAINDVTVTEGDAGTVNANFKVTLSTTSISTLTVDYATSDGTATTAGNDYLSNLGTLTFNPGETSQNFAIVVNGDNIDEGTSETFNVNLTNATGISNIADAQGVGTITDDETASFSIDDVAVTETDTGTVNAVFTVTLSNAASYTTTVDYTTSDGTATIADNDYTASSGTLTFTPGILTQTITIAVNGDTTDEGIEEVFNVDLSNATGGATITDNQGTGTITDDDTASFAINDVTVTEGDAGTVNAVFTVSLSTASASTTTVDYTTSDNTTTTTSDYIANSGTLTFNPGILTQTITVVANGDTIDEGVSETFFVDLSLPTGGATITDNQGIGTITDDDTASFSIADVTVTEGDAGTINAIFAVSLSNAASYTATIDFATSDNTATTAGADYTANSGTLTFTPGVTSQNITVVVNGDTIDESTSETYNVGLSNATGGATITDNQGIGTITDDDTASFSIDDIAVTEGNAGTVNAVFTVTLSNATSYTATVDFATSDDTATTAGADYTINSGTLTFTPGITSQNITIVVNGDTTDEGASETYNVDLLNATGGATITDNQGIGTITDDDTASFSIADATVTEGNAGTINAVFTVTLSNAASYTAEVDYATSDVTTTAGTDYTINSGTLTFNPGITSQNITVVVNGDTTDEGTSESFNLTLLNQTAGTTITDSLGVGTITDDDTASFSINDVTVTEGNAGTINAVFAVTLSNPSAVTTTVSFATSDDTATTAGNDYTANSGTLTFSPGVTSQNITIAVNGDNIDEGSSEAFNVTLSSPTGGTTITDNTGLGTITDDETASFSIDDVAENENTNIVFTVTLSNPSASTTTVAFTTVDGSATTADTDYTANSGTLTFNPGVTTQTITVIINDDVTSESGGESFTVDISNATGGATITDSSGIGNIIDNDTPNFIIDDVAVTEGNAGTVNAVFTVTLTLVSAGTETVNFATADGTATVADGDYVSNSGTLTFISGDLTKTVTVVVNGDTTDEGVSENFFVNLSASSGPAISDSQGIGTITDDETASFSINDVTVTEGNAGTVNAVYNVTLSNTANYTATVDFATSDNTTTATSDYTANSGTLTFTPGVTSQNITVVVNGDTIDEGTSETYNVNLSNPTGGSAITDNLGIGTITDDDTASFSINDVIITEGAAGPVSAIFTVTLSNISSSITTVDYATSDGTATLADTDYVTNSGTLTFNPGDLTKTFTVTINGDTIDEGASETFNVTLSGATGGATITDNTGIGTITDDDSSSFSIADVSVTEGNAGTIDAILTVTLSTASASTTTVDFATSDVTTTAGTDYTINSGTLTFNPGITSQDITVVVNGDTIDEGTSETFNVTLSGATGGATITDNTGIGTITDDETASFSINDITVTEGNAGTVNAVFAVTLSNATSYTATVNFATSDNTAAAGTDYAANSGTLTFNPGTTSQNITVVVNGDNIDEGTSEAYNVNLSTPTGGATITDNLGIGTITDDDTASFSIADVTVTEGNAGTINAIFAVTLSNQSSVITTVNYATSNGTATTANTDYTAKTGTLTFNPGITSQNITVVVNGDTTDEGTSESFNLTLSGATGGATITDNTGIGTITDDDNASFSINDITVTEGNAGTVNAVFTVTLSTPSASTTTVDFATSDNTTTAGTDYTANSGTLTFNPGITSQDITVVVNGDTTHEGASETYNITLSSATGGATITDNTGIGTITDDDSTSFSIDDVAVLEGNAGTVNAVFTVTLSTASEYSIDVAYATSDVTATAGSDYTANSGTLTFTPGTTTQTITVVVNGDSTVESASETFNVTLSGATGGATISDNLGIGTITNDDSGSFSINDVTVTGVGSASTVNAVFTVTLSNDYEVNTTIDFATSDITATAGLDYTANSGTLTFTPGTTTQTITVVVLGDDVFEGVSERYAVDLSNAGSASGPIPAILDNKGIGYITENVAALQITSAETLDCDPINGILDHYKITFNEAVTDSTITGYIANSKGNITGKWSIAGHVNVKLNHGSALNLNCGTDSVNDAVIYLTFDESDSVNTGQKPEVTTNFATVDSVSPTTGLINTTGNVIATDVTETDKASPFIWYAKGSHTGNPAPDDEAANINDTLIIMYSESTNAPTNLASIDLDTVFELYDSGTTTLSTNDFGTAADITSALWSTTNYTNDTLTLTFATDGGATVKAGPTTSDAILAIGNAITDTVSPTANNPATGTMNAENIPTITGTFRDLIMGPVITSATYTDEDSNGYIDHVKITFDQNVDESTFPGHIADNQINTVITSWQIAGYNNVAIDTTDTLDADPLDNIIWLSFSEGADFDTGAKPNITADAGSIGLAGTNTCIVNTIGLDNITCGVDTAGIVTTDVVEEDGAAPIITLTTGKTTGTGDLVFVWFSENVWSAINMPACGTGGELIKNDFLYQDNNAAGASDIFEVDVVDDCASTDAFVRLKTLGTIIYDDLDNDALSPTTAQIFDAADNEMISPQYIKIQGTVPPYVIGSSSYYDGANYWFRLVFSEPMDAVTATNTANYSLSVDSGTACAGFPSAPTAISAVSTTVFDLQSPVQCIVDQIYLITAINDTITDLNEIETVVTPNNTATTAGTGATDSTKPKLLQALSLSSTTVQLTYSEPMKTGDFTGSAECNDTFVTAATCSTDVGGGNVLYTITPSLGPILSVTATADPSVYILEHTNPQFGSYYSVKAYTSTVVTYIPEDTTGNDLAGTPENQATFQGAGTIIDELSDGSLFSDPFADNTTFSFAFNYNNRIYLGPNDANSGAFRFEADGANPVTVTFLAAGGTCTSSTFGIAGGTICGTNMGPNSETGVVGFNSGTITLDKDYEILMVGPIKSNVTHMYFTQDIDTQLNWNQCGPITGKQGTNSTSVQTTYAFNDHMYIGVSQNQGGNDPILNKIQLSQTDGILSCASPVDLGMKNVNWIGSAASNTFRNPANGYIIGIDSVIYSTATLTTNALYVANNGGVAYTHTLPPTVPGDFNIALSQTNLGGITLVLNSLGKVRPGEKGIPYFVEWNNALYMARNLAQDQTTNNTVNIGAELWKCTANCTVNTSWHMVAATGGTTFTGGTNNKAISLLQVNGDYLYIGFDNPTDGVAIFKSKEGVTEIDANNNGDGYLDFDIQGGGLGLSDATGTFDYIYSSSSLSKQGKNYIYITVGDAAGSIKVVRQVD